MGNKYIKRSRIPKAKTRTISRYFVCDIEASKIADLTGVSRNTINKILKAIRLRIAGICEQKSSFDQELVEIDESYFGARRVRGVRGRGARGKHIVFGLIKRKGKVYTQVEKNCSASTLLPIIQEKFDKKINRLYGRF